MPRDPINFEELARKLRARKQERQRRKDALNSTGTLLRLPTKTGKVFTKENITRINPGGHVAGIERAFHEKFPKFEKGVHGIWDGEKWYTMEEWHEKHRED